MKSLNDSPISNKNPEMFTPEIMKFLKEEGFEEKQNDSYCYSSLMEYDESIRWNERCLYKRAGYYSGDWPISVYIFENGIGVDIDYECGGNSSNYFWKFEDYSFEEVYDKMVDYVNDYKSR